MAPRILSLILSLYLAVLFATGHGRAAPASSTPTRISVTPMSDAVATQTVGSSAVPASFSFRLTSNRGSLNWRIGTKPDWLCANATSGKTAATVVLTICGAQPVGSYTLPFTFVASTNTVALTAKLTVVAAPVPDPIPVPPPPPPPVPGVGCPGYLLDNAAGKLTTDGGDPVTC